MHFRPDQGRVYCNVLFETLGRCEKLSYSWLRPSGKVHHRRVLTKALAQHNTWSWNYIDVSKPAAAEHPGVWTVRVSVSGRKVAEARFVLLQPLVSLTRGLLPLIFCVPHSGDKAFDTSVSGGPARVTPRTPLQGPSTSSPDMRTVAMNLAAHLTYMFHASPTIVECRIPRRFLDVDVSEEEAFSDPRASAYYHAYWEAVVTTCKRSMTLQRRMPVIVNLRPHTEREMCIAVATLRGWTCMGMSDRSGGIDVRFGDMGICSRLAGCRWLVQPSAALGTSALEHPLHAAGYMMQQLCLAPALRVGGSSQHSRDTEDTTAAHKAKDKHKGRPERRGVEWRVDGMDLVIPAGLCRGYGLRPLCKDLAEALALMLSSHVLKGWLGRPPCAPN